MPPADHRLAIRSIQIAQAAAGTVQASALGSLPGTPRRNAQRAEETNTAIVGVAIAMDAQQRVLNDLFLAVDVMESLAHEGSHGRGDLGQQGLVGEAIAVLCRSHELREPVVDVLQRSALVCGRRGFRLHRSAMFTRVDPAGNRAARRDPEERRRRRWLSRST